MQCRLQLEALILRQKCPSLSGCTVNDEQLGTVTIVQCEDTIGVSIWLTIIAGGCSHKTKIHEEFCALERNVLSSLTGRLFADVRLLLEVNQAEGWYSQTGGVLSTCLGRMSS
jgi:hypothetical protein